MVSWSVIETWPGFETVSKQRLVHTPFFLVELIKKGSAGRVICLLQHIQYGGHICGGSNLRFNASKISGK